MSGPYIFFVGGTKMETVKIDFKRAPVVSYRVVSSDGHTLGVFDSREEAVKFSCTCKESVKIQKLEKWVKINV